MRMWYNLIERDSKDSHTDYEQRDEEAGYDWGPQSIM